MNRAALRDRYMRDSLPVRLGGLAANLARVGSFSDHPDHGDVVERLVEESKFFIEWTAPHAGVDQQVDLVRLQLLLAGWHHRWRQMWADPVQRRLIAERAAEWSRHVLAMSGLLGR